MSHSAQFWCSRRLLVTIDGPQGKSVVPLSRPFARIGRQAGSDIVLNSPWVAKRSLYLHATDEGVYCFYLQPEETQSHRMGYWLAPGEPLMVGPYHISACLEGDPPGPAPALIPLDDWGSASPPYPVFQVYSSGKLRDKRRFRARLNLIGRRHECALQIKGQQVSAFHGCLFWQFPRLWYVDLVSSNGTSLNGLKVDCAEMRLGDRLVVGEFTLVFQRLSKASGSRGDASGSQRTLHESADMLPAEFDDDLPLDLDGPLAVELDEAQQSGVAGSSPVIPLATAASHEAAMEAAAAPQPIAEEEAAAPELAATSVAPVARSLAPPAEDSAEPEAAPQADPARAGQMALAPLQQTRQELAVLQRRVAELTQVAAQAGKNAAQQLAVKTREAFERERQRIAQELERRAGELAKEKLALEAQWQNASRELATQVSQLRDEAALLARQRQSMEQSRLMWDAQRADLERQLRSYAEQLHRLEHSSAAGLPAPAAASSVAQAPAPPANGSPAGARFSLPAGQRGAPSPHPFSLLGLPVGNTASIEENEAATAMVLAAAHPSGALTARSHVVAAHVAGDESEPSPAGFPGSASSPPAIGGPAIGDSSRLIGEDVLEGSVASAVAAIAPPPADAAAPKEAGVPKRSIKGRKSSKGKEVFDVVTDRLVEMEQRRRQTIVVLGIAGAVAVVALSAAMIIAAVLLR